MLLNTNEIISNSTPLIWRKAIFLYDNPESNHLTEDFKKLFQ